MDHLFLVKLALSFVVGSVWITLATVLAERLGTKLGGVLSGLPSTIVVTLFFIGWTQSPSVVVACTTPIPMVQGIQALFVATYLFLCRRNLVLSVAVSLTVWFAAALALVLLKFEYFGVGVVSWIVLLATSFYTVERKLAIPSVGRRDADRSMAQLLFRALLSGGLIALAVVLAKLGGPLLGGVFAVFPAGFLSTIVITYLAHGSMFSAAVVKVMMVSGIINPTVYAISVRYTYPAFGILWGSLISFGASLVSVCFVYWFVRKRVA